MLPQSNKNLVLIGGRGCGKSSIARRIKFRQRKLILFELDALIRYEAGGMSIPELVAARGWRHFRELEYAVTRKASAFSGGVMLDCGGGIVTDLDAEGNEIFSARKVNALRETGLVVYLQRDVDYLLNRIRDDSNRPSLSDTVSFTQIMHRRDPWYREAADLVLECKGSSKERLSNRILDWYLERGIECSVNKP